MSAPAPSPTPTTPEPGAVPSSAPCVPPVPSAGTAEPTPAGGAKTHGWSVSLGFRGRSVAQRSVRGLTAVRVGEDPACTLVVPGLGDAVTLAVGDRLGPVPGLAGVVHRDGAGGTSEPLARELTLAPGDRAELHVIDHPEITLELRRQSFPRLPLGTLVNLRELGLQLAIGAGLVAGLALLVQQHKPVNVLEVKGDPEADEDSPLVRAMFAVTTPVPELRTHALRIVPPPVVVSGPVEPVELGPAAAVAPLPMAHEGVTAPVPAAGIDEQPTRKRRRRGADALGEVAMMGVLSRRDEAHLADLLVGVEDGAPDGVLGGRIGADLLDDRTAGAPEVGMLGLVGGVPRVVEAEFAERVVEAEVEAPPVLRVDAPPPDEVPPTDSVEFVEGIMGPGVADEPPVPRDTSPGPETAGDGGGGLQHGVADGLAAVAPASDCEDPTLVKPRQLDLVFVIDVSTTMTFMLDRIEQQIVRVDQEARAQGLDTRYGLVVFVDDVKLGNAGKPFADLAALQTELATWRTFTAGNRQIGRPDPNLDWPENTLDALHTAATGFAWRPADTTLRMIVHATDDDFGEAPAVQSGQHVRHTYAQTLVALRTAQARVFSFAAKVGGQCECLDVRPGLFTRFHGRASLPEATGGAVFDIDAVASGKLAFFAAIGGAINSGVCTRYPLSPFGGPR